MNRLLQYLAIGVFAFQMGCNTQAKKEISDVDNKTISFEKIHLWQDFISEGVAVGDVNKDGNIDILAGAFWFEAPKWIPHEISEPIAFDYASGYSNSFLNYTADVNEDGWLDFICYGLPGKAVHWYENPQGEDGHWKQHLIDSIAGNESPMFVDVDGNGKKDLVYGSRSEGIMKWQQTRTIKDVTNWNSIDLSEANSFGTDNYSHGLGLGDINGDGRNDIIIREGWWEAPEDKMQTPWDFHETSLGEPCSQMYTYDFDNDGDNDVVSASAHKYGIWWHEQVLDENGEIAFKQHLISDAFSQTHALILKDMNADGLPDLITGKRYYAHLGKDPGGKDPAVIYWFELKRDDNNKPSWIPHLIDDNSGVGLNTVVEDMNGDGKLDIVVSNKKGVFYFKGK